MKKGAAYSLTETRTKHIFVSKLHPQEKQQDTKMVFDFYYKDKNSHLISII